MSECKYYYGIDWVQKDGDKTCLTILRKEDDVATIIEVLYGEAAEYVAARLNERAALKRENEKLWDAVTKIQDACDDENDMFMLNVTWLETFLDALRTTEEQE